MEKKAKVINFIKIKKNKEKEELKRRKRIKKALMDYLNSVNK